MLHKGVEGESNQLIDRKCMAQNVAQKLDSRFPAQEISFVLLTRKYISAFTQPYV